MYTATKSTSCIAKMDMYEKKPDDPDESHQENSDYDFSLCKYEHICEDIEVLIGQELRKLRKQAGLTQMAVGQEVFRSASTISSLENGCIFRNFSIFMEVCDFYSILPGNTIYCAEQACLENFYKANG